MRAVGIVLAAGAGSRMGRPKALVHEPDGTSWLVRAVGVLGDGGCDHVRVVLGADADEARPLVPDGAEVVVAQDWAEGQAASLRAGLHDLDTAGVADVAVVTLVDLPDVDAAVVRRVLGAADGRGALVRATYDGHPGHPVVLGREHWGPVGHDVSGDQGARGYLRRHDVRAVECGDLATGRDVDRPPG